MTFLKRWWKILVSLVVVLAVDLITKYFLFDIDYFNLIPGVISIMSNGGNTGAAFGIMSGQTITLIIVSILMIIALFIFNHFVKNRNTVYSIAFGFIIGGALGNLYDRIILGYVRDFIYLDFMPFFPVFNFADTFLCLGAIIMAIYLLFLSNREKPKNIKTDHSDSNESKSN